VDTVIIGGRVVMREPQASHPREPEILAKAREYGSASRVLEH